MNGEIENIEPEFDSEVYEIVTQVLCRTVPEGLSRAEFADWLDNVKFDN